MATEQRLIDANAVMTKVQRYADEPDYQHTGENWRNGVRAIEYEISIAPTVDAVEVVRCRECVLDNTTSCPLCWIENHTLQFVNHDPDFFCAFGERKDNA